jgi:hypothetical protein
MTWWTYQRVWNQMICFVCWLCFVPQLTPNSRTHTDKECAPRTVFYYSSPNPAYTPPPAP